MKRSNKKNTKNIDISFIELISQPKTKSGQLVTPLRAMQTSAVYACVGLLADTIAQMPLKLYQGSGMTRRERRDHWIYKLLVKRPNSWQTGFMFRNNAMMNLCLRGNFFAYKVRDASGRIVELLPLSADSVGVRQLENWELEYRLTLKGGSSRICSQKDIFHVAYRSLNGFSGISPIGWQRETVGLTLSAQEYGSRTFKNGARPSGVLSMDGSLTPESSKRIREEWADVYGGENTGRVAVLEKGTSYAPISMTNADAQFLETRKFQVEEIARIFGVPLFMIQSTEKTTSWGSGIEQMMMGFKTMTLNPYIECWEGAIYRDLITEAEENGDEDLEIKFNADGLLQGDIKTRFYSYQLGINMGIYSPNEVRELENLNPYDGGDIRLSPLNMRLLGTDSSLWGGENEKNGNGKEGV